MSDDTNVPIVPVKTSETISKNICDYLASGMHGALQGYVFVQALFAFVESKLYHDLATEGSLDAKASANRHGYDEWQVLGLLRYLATQDLFKERDRFHPTPYCGAVLSAPSIGRLRLYRGGYGELFQKASQLIDKSAKYGTDLTRHGGFVGTAGNAISTAFYSEVPLRILDELQINTIADMGCGSASFLVEFARRGAARRGIGVDLDEKAVAAGKARVKDAGLEDRIDLVVGNCSDGQVLQQWCKSVQVFFAQAMEHELLRDGPQAVLSHIDGMARAFPGTWYLMGEPLGGRSREQGMFYWAHVLSMQGIPLDIPAWIQLLQKLSLARLERVFRPDHEQGMAYFLIRFP